MFCQIDLLNYSLLYKVPWKENQRAYEESKSIGVQFQMNVEVKSDADRMLAEKNKEMEQIWRNSQRAIDSMQSTLNGKEQKWCWIKKKIERDTNEMKIRLSQVSGWDV